MVLDRVSMLNRVEPDTSKQPALYDDSVHFLSPETYHSFNWLLLDRLPPPASSQSNASDQVPANRTSGVRWRSLADDFVLHSTPAPSVDDAHMHAPAQVQFTELPSGHPPWDTVQQL
jgi:hypothetical protein